MKRLLLIAAIIIIITASPVGAQELRRLTAGPSLPLSCLGSALLVDVHVLTGATPGVYQCVAGAWSVMASGSVLPVNTTATASKYFSAYDSATGAFTKAFVAESDVTSLTTDLAAKAPIASPTFTGVATTPALSLSTMAAPTCDSSVRGRFNYVAGGAGVKDVVQVCAKDDANVYAWRAIY